MSNISNYTEQAASEIEKEMRAGRKFYHLDKNDTIAWFSLIGSNEAFDFFDAFDNQLLTFVVFAVVI